MTTSDNTATVLRVMSYNLRYPSPHPPNAWPARLPVARQVFQEQIPDIVGTQEGHYFQLSEIADGLPDYRWIGLGREGGSHSEFMAVFYRPERLEPLEYDHFWLSDTPNVIGSSTWGNENRRMVTWVRFRDKTTNQQFHFFNTHLDFTEDIQTRSVTLLLNRLHALAPDLPTLLVGDFNAAAGEAAAWQMLVVDGFTDTFITAPPPHPSTSTFHNYDTPGTDGPRIDWILMRGGFEAVSTKIVRTVSETGQYPSDHFPVRADVLLRPT